MEAEHYMFFAWRYESRDMEDTLEGILGGREVGTGRRGLPRHPSELQNVGESCAFVSS